MTAVPRPGAPWLEDDAAQARHPGPGRRTEDAHPRRTRLPLDHRGRLRRAGAARAARLVGRLRRWRSLALGGLGIGVPWLVWEGHRRLGPQLPVGWAWDITNFVFWVGIGHAGTLISADPLPVPPEVAHVDQPRRRGDDASSPSCARSLFPGIHVGRIWVAYWMFPLPNQMGDVAELPEPAAVGRVRGLDLLHGLAAVLVHRPDPRPRDAARPRQDDGPALRSTAFFALGWRGSHAPLAALRDGLPDPRRRSRRRSCSRCTRSCRSTSPSSQLPGWHTTIFPPYFVAGAIFSGFAMVLTLMVIRRKALRPREHHHHAPPRQHAQDHPRRPGSMVGYAYSIEFFIAWYSRQPVRAVRLHQPRLRPLLRGPTGR